MPEYLFHRLDLHYPIECNSDNEATREAKYRMGTMLVTKEGKEIWRKTVLDNFSNN